MPNTDWNNEEDCKFVQGLCDDYGNKHPSEQTSEQYMIIERYAEALDYLETVEQVGMDSV